MVGGFNNFGACLQRGVSMFWRLFPSENLNGLIYRIITVFETSFNFHHDSFLYFIHLIQKIHDFNSSSWFINLGIFHYFLYLFGSFLSLLDAARWSQMTSGSWTWRKAFDPISLAINVRHPLKLYDELIWKNHQDTIWRWESWESLVFLCILYSFAKMKT